MNKFWAIIAIGALESASLYALTGPAFSQSQGPTPQELKASLEGLTKEQIREKYMAIAAKNLNFSDKWPVNFPLPKYTGNVVQTSWLNSTKGSPTASASLSSKDSPEMVYKFYLDACNQRGWKTKAPTAKAREALASPDKFFMLQGTKDNQIIQLFCSPNPKLHGTNLSIMWLKVRKPV